ncbi:hypothetical protein [Nocardia sp. NPDC046763]
MFTPEQWDAFVAGVVRGKLTSEQA